MKQSKPACKVLSDGQSQPAARMGKKKIGRATRVATAAGYICDTLARHQARVSWLELQIHTGFAPQSKANII